MLPTPKTSAPSNLNEFRAVSILPSLSKPIEKIIVDQIMLHVEDNNLLTEFQSGFRKKHSTATALACVSQELSEILDQNGCAYLVLLDFSRAFDMVSHSLLINKLKRIFLFSESACKLINAYLQNRFQKVLQNGVCSELKAVQVGVPQGTITGPLFFSLFINDIIQSIKYCSFHLYADDLQIYIGGKKEELVSVAEYLNDDLSRVFDWSIRNGLRLNPKKTQALFIQHGENLTGVPCVLLGGEQIPFCEKAKNLGVIFNSTLTWDDHVISLIQRIYYSLRSLSIVKHLTPINTRYKLVRSLIEPQFTYCDVVFNSLGSRSSRILQVAFNACLKYIFNLRRYDHVSEHSSKLFGCTLSEYLDLRLLVFMFNLLKYQKPKYLFDKLTLSSSQRTRNVMVIQHRTNSGHNSILGRGIRMWNQLPLNLKIINSFEGFKSGVLKFLLAGRGEIERVNG